MISKQKLTLGITTIGDLLFRNKITSTNADTPIESLQLVIPEYQRPYKWTAQNVNQLLDDIEEAMKGNKRVFRVGTLILHHDKNEKFCHIVDGQQRTITFSLLLKCLSHDPIPFLEQKLPSNIHTLHNVVNNYRVMERRIDRFEDDKGKQELLDYIMNCCEMIVVMTDDLSEAFQFFDSQNARGKSLYPHDLLKAYHLREMAQLPVAETEHTVRMWEELDQKKLAVLFNEYLYRLKEWLKGNWAYRLNEHNIDLFKGVTGKDLYPYAQYYKGAYAYADELNGSHMPFVTGMQPLRPFQLTAPVIAGKPFFEFAKHYFDILESIRNNEMHEGIYIHEKDMIKTLNLKQYRNGKGNRITRLMFDTAILLYIDRFCPVRPSRTDQAFLDQFVLFALIWAYSMRAQYVNVSWVVAQNYIMGNVKKESVVNGFNLYQLIVEADSPNVLLGRLSDRLVPLRQVTESARKTEGKTEEGVPQNYLHYFAKYKFWEGA